MNFEDYQELWQNQPTKTPLPAEHTAAELAQVRKRARTFDRKVLWRDLREGLAAVFVAIFFGWNTWTVDDGTVGTWKGWTAVGLVLAIAAFVFVDRWRARQRRPKGGDTVVAELDHMLAEVRHQAWLLTHVLWWYIMPITACFIIWITFVLGQTPPPPEARMIVAGIMFVAIASTDAIIWWLNRRAVRSHLRPLIEELENQRHDFTAP